MAFTTAEKYAIKRELGHNLLTTDAAAYVETSQLLDAVINSYIDAEVATTTTLTTAITAASEPAPHTLDLASATGISAGAVVYIDVDDRAERCTIQYLSGTNITVLLKKAHAGTIPVSLEGPIPIAKDILRRISDVKAEMSDTFGDGPLKKVDEVEFYEGSGGTTFGRLGEQLKFWRRELSAALGMPDMWERRSGGGCMSVTVY